MNGSPALIGNIMTLDMARRVRKLCRMRSPERCRAKPCGEVSRTGLRICMKQVQEAEVHFLQLF